MGSETIMLVTGALTSVFAMMAIYHDKFRKIIASLLCLLAALAPWIIILPIFNITSFLPGNAATATGLFGAPPLLIAAFFLFGAGTRYPERGRVAGFALTGLFASLVTCLATIHLLSKME